MEQKEQYLTIPFTDENGKKTTLKEQIGKTLVIYFYPKDDTPGCTTEACSFRDHLENFKDMDVKVVGMSKDGYESHQKFIQKYNLNFPLWSDESGELMEAFDAIGEKKSFGKTYIGVKRSTVILDKEGNVIKHFKSVKPNKHTEQVLTYLLKKIAN